MPEFKGFSDWIAIFKGGQQTDSKGKVHDGNALIEKAVSLFDPARHEPPAVAGHPKDNAPAYGWVAGLKKEGDLLLAKFRDVVPEFEAAVRDGLFKKRSAAFYPDGSLRHVGFLGAAPPAVKELPDISFAAGEAEVFEYEEMKTESDKSKEAKPMKFSEFLEMFKFWKEVSRNPELELPPGGSQGKDGSKTFSEADLEAARTKADEDARKSEREKVTAEFAERDRKTRQDARKTEIKTWCDSMVTQGKMTPAMIEFGIPELMAVFAEREEAVEFTEGTGKVKKTPFERFKEFFEKELPRVVDFKEKATREKDVGGSGQAAKKISDLVQEKMKANKDLTYNAAFTEVQREHPDLAREYAAEFTTEVK